MSEMSEAVTELSEEAKTPVPAPEAPKQQEAWEKAAEQKDAVLGASIQGPSEQLPETRPGYMHLGEYVPSHEEFLDRYPEGDYEAFVKAFKAQIEARHPKTALPVPVGPPPSENLGGLKQQLSDVRSKKQALEAEELELATQLHAAQQPTGPRWHQGHKEVSGMECAHNFTSTPPRCFYCGRTIEEINSGHPGPEKPA